MSNNVVLWDFDGTLAYRPGMWRGCMMETLNIHEPGHGIQPEAFIPYLKGAFPWHRPDDPHHELSTPKAWWEAVEALLAQAYEEVGFPRTRAADLAHLAHARYADWTVGWTLFDDTLPVLTRLASRGWRHVILSNHVPELPSIVRGLGMGHVIDQVLTSALIGYEKPHPCAFATAFESCGRPRTIWMVGDNPLADVAGAEAAGISAILVRTTSPGDTRCAADLAQAEQMIDMQIRTPTSPRQ